MQILAIRPTPASRRVGALQGWILVSCAWLAVMASGVLAPVLPRMTAAFRSQPHVDLLISLTATFPALFVALLAWPFGILGDRVGHARVLFWATVLYGVFGTAPMFLQTLPEIVVSRALVGVAEAAIMTCSTALIGDYFGPDRRGRYLALQTGTAPIVAILIIALGGVLGESGWRAPFLAYGFGFLLIPLTGLLLWEPQRSVSALNSNGAVGTPGPSAPAIAAQSAVTFRWGELLGICAITLFVMTAFMITIIQMGFLLTERGLSSPGLIGLWSSIASLANPLGAMTFALLRWKSAPKVALCLVLMSVGFFIMSLLPGWQAAVVGAWITNFGAGLILPTLITWAITTLPAQQRGTGTGLWMAASFLGQFLSPLIVLWLKNLTGSLSNAIMVYAMACSILSLIAISCLVRPAAPQARGAASG